MAFLLNKSDMASSIGISVQAFDKWGVPPVERRGREVFYDVKTVLEIDRERRQQNQKSSGGENDLEERLLQARVNLTEEQAIAQRLKNQVAEHKVIDTAFSIFALSRLQRHYRPSATGCQRPDGGRHSARYGYARRDGGRGI